MAQLVNMLTFLAPLVLAGVKDVIVVVANGRVLVVDRAGAGDLKQVLEAIPPGIRELE